MNQLQGTLIVILSTAMWGIAGVCGQYLFEHTQIDSTWMITIRQLIAGVIYMGITAAKGKESLWGVWKSGAVNLREMILFSLGLLGAQYGFYSAIRLSNAPTATVLIYTEPVFVVLYQLIVHHRRPESREIFGIFLALTGVFLICTHGDPHSLIISPSALFWAILSALAMTVYTVCPVHLLKEYTSPYIMGWGQLIAGVLLIPFCHLGHSGVDAWTWQTAGALAYIIVLGTVVPFLMYFVGLKVIGPVKAALISCCEPLCSILLSVLLLGTVLTLPDYTGMACIIVTILLMSVGKK